MSDKTHSRHHAHTEEASSFLSFRAVLLGTLTFLITSFVLLAVASMICLKLPDPSVFLFPFSLVILFLPSLIGGIVAVKVRGGAAIPIGLMTGVILFLLSLMAALLLPGAPSGTLSFSLSLILRLLIPVFSTLGALLGIHLQPKPKHRR